MKLWIKSLLLFIIIYLILPVHTLARSGCCSHHGGVCGCRCCDGSSLSATCAPYYPSCNSAPIIKRTYPTSIPTRTPTRIVRPTTISNYSSNNQNKTTTQTSDSDGSTTGGLLLAGAGYVGYKLLSKKKNRKTA